MATLQAFDRISADTTADLLARLPEPDTAEAPAARRRPVCLWRIDCQTGRPVAHWVIA